MKTEHTMEHHITPPRTYWIIGAALIVLTGLTVAVAFVNLGPLNDVVALGVASVKAALVVIYFMHARYSRGITRLVIVAGLLWLGILIVGVMDDYLTRDWLATPGR